MGAGATQREKESIGRRWMINDLPGHFIKWEKVFQSSCSHGGG